VALLTSVAASTGTPECGLRPAERFQTSSRFAGARDDAVRGTGVVFRELVTPYDVQFPDTLKYLRPSAAFGNRQRRHGAESD
jgi:hypothetical protein